MMNNLISSDMRWWTVFMSWSDRWLRKIAMNVFYSQRWTIQNR